MQGPWETLIRRLNPAILMDGDAASGTNPGAPLASLIAAAGALWGVVNTAANTTEAINNRRDAVIAGRLAGAPIAVDHRFLIIDHDWWGMVIATIAGCALFAMLMAILAASQRRWYFGLFFLSCATLSLINAGAWVVSLKYEQQAMVVAVCRDIRFHGQELADRTLAARCPQKLD